MAGWFLRCVSLQFVYSWTMTIYALKWWIQVPGSSSVLAETGDGTGKPREQFLYTTSRQLYEGYLRNSISVFGRFAVEGRFSERL
jgi:hypothetical protein